MEVASELSDLHLEGCALSIGAFDGVHRGHQKLVLAMVDWARAERMPSVVLTFYPHPSVVLRGRDSSHYLTLPEDKAVLLRRLGVDHVVTQRFDLPFSHISADLFLDRVLDAWGVRSFWVGEDFAFGHDRLGTVGFLRGQSSQRGFTVEVVPPLLLDGEVVSSTRVREALRSGDVARAASYLGRRFSLRGLVQRGAGRGRQLGIPTANLEIEAEMVIPGPGVYACMAQTVSARFRAVTNIGTRPTFEETSSRPVVEAHLLGFDSDLYGQGVELEFVGRLRDERKFSGPDALRAQIGRDIQRAEEILTSEAVGADG
ncbi:MAG: bifunctional riboflavin kinase/FAD synthetase [Anaerolineales bacterium]